MKNEASKPMSLAKVIELLHQLKEKAEAKRDEIAVDASDANQRNWHFFNGKATALQEVESTIRLYIDAFPMPNMVELVEDGKMFVSLSNGERVSLAEDRENLHIGQVDPSGEDWWICSINRNGVLCAPNSGSACEVLAANLGSTPEEVNVADN